MLLALFVAILQAAVWWITPRYTSIHLVGPPRSGYTLTSVQLWSYDAQGRPDFSMIVPRLERRSGDAALYLDMPGFTLTSNTPGVPDWHGHSRYGWVNKNNTLIKLQGPVHMQRAAYGRTPPVTVDSANVSVWPKQNRIATSAPTRLTQGSITMNGIGMRADLNSKQLELLHDSHGSFLPRQH